MYGNRPTAPDSDSDQETPEAGEEFSAQALDFDVDALLEQYQVGLATFSASRETTAELKRKCLSLERTKRNLRSRVESLSHPDSSVRLREAIDELESNNSELLQLVHDTERHYNALALEFSEIEKKTHNLRLTVVDYRKLVQALLLERDSLAEQKKQLIAQVGSLNRNYDSLRLEYFKLYRINH